MQLAVELLTILHKFSSSFEFGATEVNRQKKFLTSAVKYVFPDQGERRLPNIETVADLIRMPFPEMVFEYGISKIVSAKFVVMLIDLNRSTSDLAQAAITKAKLSPDAKVLSRDQTIAIYAWSTMTSIKEWVPLSQFCVASLVNTLRPGEKPMSFTFAKMAACPSELKHAHFKLIEDLTFRSLIMLAQVNARNLKTCVVYEPRKIDNLRRKDRGELPLFTYHTLDVFLNPEVVGKERRVRSLYQMQNALISGMRLHQVAGHFKRRKTGIFWWSSFARGSGTKGVIKSDYEVH